MLYVASRPGHNPSCETIFRFPEVLFLNWTIPGLFSFIFVFSYRTITEKFSSQRDSNTDFQSSRRERWPLYHHHGHMKYFMLKALHRGSVHVSYPVGPGTILGQPKDSFSEILWQQCIALSSKREKGLIVILTHPILVWAVLQKVLNAGSKSNKGYMTFLWNSLWSRFQHGVDFADNTVCRIGSYFFRPTTRSRAAVACREKF